MEYRHVAWGDMARIGKRAVGGARVLIAAMALTLPVLGQASAQERGGGGASRSSSGEVSSVLKEQQQLAQPGPSVIPQQSV